MDREEGSTCLICCDALLVSTVGALVCGHVYHKNCIVLWLQAGKAHCPLCKKKNRIDDVRTVDFDMRQVPGLSDEEVQRLEATSLAERAQQREELEAGKAEADAAKAQVDGELALLRDLAQERKRARKELEADGQLLLEANLELTAELSNLKTECAALQAGLDAEAPRLQRKLPISQPREGDPDLQEERRKLKAFRPIDRARRVHEALTSARQQENEKQHDNADRTAALKRAEDELRDLRQQEFQLRRELEDRRWSAEAREVLTQASTVSAPPAKATSSTSLASSEASVTQPSPVVRRQVAVEVATPQGKANLRRETEHEEEDTDILYGGARPALSARGGLLGRAPSNSALQSGVSGSATKAAGSKWGALFKSASATVLPTPASSTALPPDKAKTSMKSLFANRRG